jgi:anion-transporting  ArsA/GET3 family ATPase
MAELQNINQNLQSIAQNFVQSLKDKDLVGHLKTIDDILQQIQILFNNTQTHQNCFLKDSFFDTSEITKELKNLQNQIVKLQELYTDYKNAIQNQNTIEAVKMAKEINSFTIEFQLQTDPEAVFQKKIQELIQTQINWLEASLKTVAKK